MTENFTVKKGRITYLLKECVVELHSILSNNTHLLEDMDPVKPEGIKNNSMLESAVNRQLTGSGKFYKYSNPFSNAATLTYGVIKNHAFHNGNKRTGLLSLIKHLYVNGYVLKPGVSSDSIYQFLIAIADNKLKQHNLKQPKKERLIKKKSDIDKQWDIDFEVRYIELWIKKNSAPKSNTIKGDVKTSLLTKILKSKGINTEVKGTKIEVFILKDGFIFKKKRKKRSYNLLNSSNISKGNLFQLRKDFGLTRNDGVDDSHFYDDETFLDEEIKTYKKLIYNLSKT